LIGTLPFLGFGVISILGKLGAFHNPQVIAIYLAFYVGVLIGVLVGWVRGFPLWSYGYLGWSLLITWWLAGARINGSYWGMAFWFLFVIMILVALLWTRSLDPLTKLLSDIANDWSRLSLGMYTFITFVYLIYDENHHPYLLIFMAAATLAMAAGTWFFLRSTGLKGRVSSMVGGLVAGYLIGTICDRTWDAAAYYGFPEGPPDPWFLTVYRTFMILAFFSAILLWPVGISLLQHVRKKFAS
jgi:hypothetical protein